jgi:hypothetical protein
MKLCIISDAWSPQINGVVNTLKATIRELEKRDVMVHVISPQEFRTIPCPTYPDIRLALFPARQVTRRLDEIAPDAVHIATEGPLGLAARRYCVSRKINFTTAYHTRFPEYIYARCRLPLSISYAWMRWFHKHSKAIMVPTDAVERELAARGLTRLVRWSRGVNTDVFRPGPRDPMLMKGVMQPVFLYVGRVAVEKNIEEFLSLDLPGVKWVVGDGPARAQLEERYPDATFFGMHVPPDLVRFYQSADVFVFPSRTDTFGLVSIEAMACGTPVAAFPVPGPLDVVRQGESGVLRNDLRDACIGALNLSRARVREEAMRFSWAAATTQFVRHLHVSSAAPHVAAVDVQTT